MPEILSRMKNAIQRKKNLFSSSQTAQLKVAIVRVVIGKHRGKNRDRRNRIPVIAKQIVRTTLSPENVQIVILRRFNATFHDIGGENGRERFPCAPFRFHLSREQTLPTIRKLNYSVIGSNESFITNTFHNLLLILERRGKIVTRLRFIRT